MNSHRLTNIRRLFRVVILSAWLSHNGTLAFATQKPETTAEETATSAEVDYLKQVKPVLKARCYACHGSLKQEAGLRLDAGSLIRSGSEGGAVVMTDRPGDSPLLDRVSTKDASRRMPPEGEPLTDLQINSIATWIQQGAETPEGEQPEADPRQHWSFQPVRQPEVPLIDTSLNPGYPESTHPIDAFLAKKHIEHGIQPLPPAPAAVQLRRLYIDLIGLPPRQEELHAFLADKSHDAWEKVVDRLLNDPRHGERWARHWMDIWRYSDWYGRRDVNDVRNSASQLFRWRDWIVQSLNSDKGYDRMVQEMLAGDEIFPEDDDAATATGYLIRNYYSLNPNDWMRNTVEHTGKAFLGLTFNCAHCHDHKYDPIMHEDYFRMRAFFEPIFIRQDRIAGEADPGIFQDYTYAGTRSVTRLGIARIFDRSPEAPTWFYTGGDERNRLKDRGSIPAGLPAFLAPDSLKIDTVSLPARAWYPGLRPAIQEAALTDARTALAQAETELAAAKMTATEVPPELLTELSNAETELKQALLEAEQGAEKGALSGRQSLLLDATTGRRIVQRLLTEVAEFSDGAMLNFQLMILNDAHFNFQFVKDSAQGLTAGYLAFDQGRIMAYQPGTTSDFQAGKYDFAAGQNRFDISFTLQPSADRALLTVYYADGTIAVDAVPVALNGWSPVNNPLKPISFDARPGSAAVIDNFVWTVPVEADNSNQAKRHPVYLDFEPPSYAEGQELTGSDQWTGSSYSIAPAVSVISSTSASMSLNKASRQVKNARMAIRQASLPLLAAEARLVSAQASLSALEAVIAADRAKYEGDRTADQQMLIQTASRLEREAALRKAESDVLLNERSLAVATAKPADDATRGKEIEAAGNALSVAMKAEAAARAALADEKLAETYTSLSPVYPQQSTGRRKALAEWMTSPENPLTARVAVNHLWSWHFHSPIVASVSDFGRNGDAPTHPELLDWMAAELMKSGWKMKHLHRIIVTSTAYRRFSGIPSGQDIPAAVASASAADPENKLLWRMNPGRMESEVVRDSLLYCAGVLDSQIGGVELENSQALTTRRRSLYYSIHPEAGGRSPLGQLFDAPDPLDCYRRTSSIVPQQALALTNSDLVHELSRVIAGSWEKEHSANEHQIAGELPRDQSSDQSHDPFIVDVFEQILSRTPTDTEHQICRRAIEQQVQLSAEASVPPTAAMTAARESLVRALLNHNDFVTVR